MPDQTSRPRLSGAIPWLLLIAILALGAVLRFRGLEMRGLVMWDEAKFALEGIRLDSILTAGPLAGKAVGSAKPSHALLIALAYLIFGIHDWSSLLMNAVASLLEIVLLYLLARRLFGPGVALLAAALLAVSTYDVIYARSALSECDATAAFLAGVLVWSYATRLRPDEPPRLRFPILPATAGLLLGFAFTINYRLIVYLGVFVAGEVVWHLWREGPGVTLRRAVPLLVGVLIPPLLWQIAGIVAADHGMAIFLGDLTQRRQTYLQEVIYQVHEGKQSVVRFEPMAYIQWFLAREGWPVFLLMLAGLLYVPPRRSLAWLMPAAMVLLPYAVYVFAPFVVPRNLVVLIPFACLLASAGAVSLAGHIPSLTLSRAALLLAALALVALGTGMTWPLTTVRSGFARAATYIQQQGANRTLTSTEIMVFYFRGPGTSCRAPTLPLKFSRLRLAEDAGIRFAVLEYHDVTGVSEYIRAHDRRVAHIPSFGPDYHGENIISSENTNPPSDDIHYEYVDVYRLPVPHPLPGGNRPFRCREDAVT